MKDENGKPYVFGPAETPFLSRIFTMQFDCETSQNRLIEDHFFSKNMGDGTVVDLGNKQTTGWIGTVGGTAPTLQSIACGKAPLPADHNRTESGINHSALGIKIQEVTKNIAEYLGLPYPTGAMIVSVNDNSPAAAAGFRQGDVILSYNGHHVVRWVDLPPMVENTPVGEKFTVIVLRNGGQLSLESTMAAASSINAAKRDSKPNPWAISPNNPPPSTLRRDPCRRPEIRSPGAVSLLNSKIGQPSGPSKRVSTIEDTSDDNGPGDISCRATLMYSDGTEESGSLSFSDPGADSPALVYWQSDSDKAEAELNRPACGTSYDANCRWDQQMICGNSTPSDCAILQSRFSQQFAACFAYAGTAISVFNFYSMRTSKLFAEESLSHSSSMRIDLLDGLISSAYSGRWKTAKEFSDAAVPRCMHGNPF